ncbi:UBX domain-containing protein [Chloropicon roscoffensis]|uniref:UBX domain-containing protein n=1 Tax=Chloropicon roscoffensis TaxID=1461544 RepID=A0A7S3FQI8_9CHLO
MEGAERDEALSTFIAVTGAPYERAREVLDTNDWDLQRALNTHLEVQQHTTSNTAGVAAQRTQQQSSVAAGLQGGNVIDLADDIMDEISLQRRRGGVEANAPPIQTQPLQSRLSANEGEVLDLDAEDANERSEANRSAGAANAVDADRNFIEEQLLKQALEESLQTVTQQHSVANAVGEEAQGMDEDLTGPSSSAVAGSVKRVKGAARNLPMPQTGATGTATHLGQFSSVDDGPSRMEADNHFGVLHDSPHVSHNLQRSNSYSSQNNSSQDKDMVDSTMADAQHSAPTTTRNAEGEDIILPDGVNAEEAKMLEAAMFGIPYQGPVTQTPSYRDTISSSSMNPEVRAQRQIRMEQDRAFHASLRADQEKEAVKRREEEEKKRKLQEEVDQKRKEVERKEQMLAKIQAELSEEPEGPAEDVVNVMIRLPDGSRLSRKFLKQSPVRLLFHFVDYAILTDKAALEMTPGGYKLSTQFPRKTITDSETNTLEDVGLVNKQEALFMEKI